MTRVSEMSGKEGARMRQSGWPAWLVASATLVLLLGLAGCGQETTAAGIRPKPTATATATPTASPTPIPYPQQWQAASGLPATVGGYAFAQSEPQTGYACTLTIGGPADFWTTTDSGQTWSAIPQTNTAVGSDGCDVSVDPANSQDVFLWDSAIMERSQDGGHTWVGLAGLVGQSGPSMWRNITVIGTRLVAVGIPTGGSDLYASDDGGQTWKPIGQSIAAQNLNVGNFVTVGQTLYVSGYPICAGGPPIDGCQGDALAEVRGAFGGGTSGATSGAASGNASNVALDLPLSGDRPVPYRYFASTDGGNTFTEMKVPGAAALSGLSFTPNPSGGFYGVVLSTSSDLSSTIYWSNNGGSSWQSMPAVDGSVPGRPDPTAFGIMGRLIVCPDGSVIAGAWRQRFPPDGDGDLGFYQAPGGIAFAKWQPIAAGGIYQLGAVPQGEDVRVWALRYTGSLWQGSGSTQSGDTLESITFQATS